jgi:hypothetical protein
MTRRTLGLLVTLALGLLAVPLAAAVQPPGKVPRIGVLVGGGQSPPSCSHSGSCADCTSWGTGRGRTSLLNGAARS